MIRSDRLLYELEPDGFGARNCEPWAQWRLKAKQALPNFPDDVLKQWVYRHWKGVLCNWGWLDFQSMQFSLEEWSSEQIQSKIQTPHQEVVDKLSSRMQNPIYQRSWLVQAMQETGTWPVAPIVLHYERDIPMMNGKVLKANYNLLEGHHRLAYLNRLLDDGLPVQPCHQVWVIRIPLH
ncbi:hypothetical protein C9I98_03795 [Photobacterium sanctipauli]|uniref:Uncharacterized protein n=1 Tax=Photobacterium sanctipauli TaxID=1342794 RepID=A0A2T3NXQ4_9GAMM|nr:hypothetical protein [Photobacterium sanctipauli]PSW21083.1 hypothetical protein C9I98_03795 [Photobacterium sanctipauli]